MDGSPAVAKPSMDERILNIIYPSFAYHVLLKF